MPAFLTRDRSLRWLAAIGYGWALTALALVVMHDGGRAYDAHAYWLAGRHGLEGTPLCDPNVDIETLGAFKYPPLFAQAFAPFAVLPELAFDWLWRIVCLLALRGRPTYLPVAIALKFGPALLVPFILLRRSAADRRRLLLGLGAFAALFGHRTRRRPPGSHSSGESIDPLCQTLLSLRVDALRGGGAGLRQLPDVELLVDRPSLVLDRAARQT